MNTLHLQRFNEILGGRERYVAEVCSLLQSHGNRIAGFTLAEPIAATEYTQGYSAPRLRVDSSKLSERLQAAAFRLYNPQAASLIRQIARTDSYDVAHIHALHHLSVSVLQALRQNDIPTVLTLHDYHTICPNTILFVDGAPCERCLQHRYYQTIIHRCCQGKMPNSIISALDNTLLHLSGELSHISTFIAPSRFVQQKAIAFGLPPDKVTHLPHFAPIDKWIEWALPQSGSIVYAGRLYEQKGVHVLIEALGRLKLPANQQVIIIGDGPEMEALKKQSSRLMRDQIIFTGFQTHEQILIHLQQCAFAVVPSIWYEVLGYAILEPYTVGRPVVASRIGGIPEVVTHDVDGRLAEPNNADDLATQIDWMLTHPARVKEMGQAARRCVEERFSPEAHYTQLMQIYNNAITSRTH